MKKEWNEEEPIEVFFNQIEEAAECVQRGNAPFTNTQVLNTAFVVIAQAKIFKDACEEQHKVPAANKTQPNFKTHFFTACAEQKDNSKCEVSEYADTNLANHTRDTAEALQTVLQVSNAIAEDKAQQMANLTNQIQDLHNQLQTLASQLSNIRNIL